jgi:hypothetical protein
MLLDELKGSHILILENQIKIAKNNTVLNFIGRVIWLNG